MTLAALALLLPLTLAQAPAPDLVAARAAALLDERKVAEALPLLEEAHRARPDDPEVSFLLGRALLESSPAPAVLDRAIPLLEDAVKARDRVSRWHHVLGTAYGRKAQTGMLAGARYAGKVKAEFERAVALDPANVPARRGLVDFYLMAPAVMGGSDERAEEQARALEEVDRFSAAGAWASIHRKRGDWDGYLKRLDEAASLAATPDQRNRLSVNLNGAGYRLLGDGRTDRALALFRRAAALTPDDPNTHDSLGEALLATKAWSEAAQSYRRALDLGATGNVRESSRLGLGLALEGAGDAAGARQAYAALLAEKPVDEKRVKRARERMEALGR